MAHLTSIAWWCSCGTRNPGDDPTCFCCSRNRVERYANVRSSERAAIDVSQDGSISVPGRIDRPLHPKQIALGVQRVEIDSATSGRHSLAHLERLGLVHEATNWNSSGLNVPLSTPDVPDRTPKPLAQILSEPDAF